MSVGWIKDLGFMAYVCGLWYGFENSWFLIGIDCDGFVFVDMGDMVERGEMMVLDCVVLFERINAWWPWFVSMQCENVVFARWKAIFLGG